MSISKKMLVLSLLVFALLSLGTAAIAAQGGTMTAHYYGTTVSLDILTEQRAAEGGYIHCVSRPPSSERSVDVLLDCYDTVEEADRQLYESRPDLAYLESESLKHHAKLSCGTKSFTGYYNAGYNTVIPALNNVCTSKSWVNANMYSTWVNGTTCVRLWQFTGFTGNSAVVCATYWYYYYGVGSMQWLG